MRNSLARNLAALLSGLLFGFGLCLSGMLDPARVRGFLDIAGRFDPSLAFVLTGALAVSCAGYQVSRRLRRPLLDNAFHFPKKNDIDLPLITGAAIFGIGWGMGGLCPGPAITSLALGFAPVYIFAAMMIAGILIHDKWAQSKNDWAQRRQLPLERSLDADADA